MKKNNVKYLLFNLFIYAFIFTSCNTGASRIDLIEIDKHREYQDSKKSTELKDLIDEYNEVLEKNPNAPEALFLLSRLYEKSDIEKVKSLNKKALLISPNFYESNLAMGQYYSKDLFDSSIYYYQKCIEISPSKPIAYYNICNLYCNLSNKNSNLNIKNKLLLHARENIILSIKYESNYNNIKEANEILSLMDKNILLLKNLIDPAVSYADPAVSYADAEAFMRDRCRSTNQELIDGKSVYFGNSKIYMFLTYTWDYSHACITGVSQNALEILNTDCGSVDNKSNEFYSL
jgi:hypothetical protein